MRAGVTNDHAVVAQFAVNERHNHRIVETQCGRIKQSLVAPAMLTPIMHDFPASAGQ